MVCVTLFALPTKNSAAIRVDRLLPARGIGLDYVDHVPTDRGIITSESKNDNAQNVTVDSTLFAPVKFGGSFRIMIIVVLANQ